MIGYLMRLDVIKVTLNDSAWAAEPPPGHHARLGANKATATLRTRLTYCAVFILQSDVSKLSLIAYGVCWRYRQYAVSRADANPAGSGRTDAICNSLSMPLVRKIRQANGTEEAVTK
jgi:hypothetical protein